MENSLVLVGEGEKHNYFFLSNLIGGFQVYCNNSSIFVVSINTPLGKELLNKHVKSSIKIINDLGERKITILKIL